MHQLTIRKIKSFAIIGCGLAGLATATYLARRGHAITLIDQFKQPASIGAGILLQPTGIQILKDLGLLDALENVSSRIDALQGFNQKHRLIMDVQYSDLRSSCYGLGVHRANLFNLLFKAATDAGAKVVCDRRINTISTISSAGKYRLRGHREFQTEFDAVIVADGTQSKLRPQLNIPSRLSTYPWGALWAICPNPDNQYSSVLAQRYHGAHKMIGVLPTGLHPVSGEPCVSFFWSLPAQNHAAWQKTELAEWKSQVLDYWPEIGNLVNSFQNHTDLSFAVYGDVMMRRWHVDATVCIGDAAHATSPQLGQGTNLALIDAYVLDACISTSEDLPSAFAKFSTARKQHLRFYQFASRRLTPLFQSNNRPAAYFRDMTFPLIRKIPFLHKQAIRTVCGVKTGLIFDRPSMGVMLD